MTDRLSERPVSTTLPPGDLLNVAHEELAAIDPNLVIHNVRSMREIEVFAMARERLAFILLSLFAATALSLAAVGIYGVMAYNVSRRAREFGIRLAMGAGPGNIRRSVVRHGAVMVGAGVTVGLLGSFALSRLLSSMLFEVSPADPLIFVAVPLALVLAALRRTLRMRKTIVTVFVCILLAASTACPESPAGRTAAEINQLIAVLKMPSHEKRTRKAEFDGRSSLITDT